MPASKAAYLAVFSDLADAYNLEAISNNDGIRIHGLAMTLSMIEQVATDLKVCTEQDFWDKAFEDAEPLRCELDDIDGKVCQQVLTLSGHCLSTKHAQ